MSDHLLILTEKDHSGRDRVWLDGYFGMNSYTESKIRAGDLDRSFVLRVVSHKPIADALGLEFTDFEFFDSFLPPLLRRSKSDRLNRKPIFFVAEDDVGRSIAQRMVEFIYRNRLSLGDDGRWQVWTCRDLLLNQSGSNLSDLAHAERKRSVLVKALPDADYTDELESFRFPSISCLYGVSQPLAKLGGATKFRQLFIQDGSGVYVAFQDNEALYVGMSQQFSQRLSSAEGHHKLKLVLNRHPQARVAVIHYPVWKFHALDYAVKPEEKEAAWARIRELLFDLERACIEYYQPKYNGSFDDECWGNCALSA